MTTENTLTTEAQLTEEEYNALLRPNIAAKGPRPTPPFVSQRKAKRKRAKAARRHNRR